MGSSEFNTDLEIEKSYKESHKLLSERLQKIESSMPKVVQILDELEKSITQLDNQHRILRDEGSAWVKRFVKFLENAE